MTGTSYTGSRIPVHFPPRWLLHYRRDDLAGDIMAGVIVAIMLVPQGMAYALLAGMPAQAGLYASIIPPVVYGLLGSTSVLAVGPTAITSLLVAAAVAPLAGGDMALYMQLSLVLALLAGMLQLGMGLLRAGFLVNFLSHPVLSGFVSAAALVIGVGQLKHIFGIDVPRTEHFYETVLHTVEGLGSTNPAALVIGLFSIAVLLYFKFGSKPLLKRLPGVLRIPVSKAGPLVVVVVGILAVQAFSLDVNVVGSVPAGLPPLTLPVVDTSLLGALIPTAVTLALIGFMESMSVAKPLASKRRQKVDPDRELVALGASNIGASLTGGFPVTGGLSRSVVNFNAGANTGLASIITAGLMALTVTFLMGLFFYLPQAALAAIIIVAVATLFDWSAFTHAWHYSKADALSLAVTFVAVLIAGIEGGIIVGAAVSMALYLWQTSRPHIAVVGRVGDSEHFRNVLRHDVHTCPHVLAVRVDESLYFPNAQYLENALLAEVADRPEVDHVVLVCSAVNVIDTSALEILESLHQELKDAGVAFHMAEVKGPVMDRLQRIGFVDALGAEHIFLSTHAAMVALGCVPDGAAAAAPSPALEGVATRAG